MNSGTTKNNMLEAQLSVKNDKRWSLKIKSYFSTSRWTGQSLLKVKGGCSSISHLLRHIGKNIPWSIISISKDFSLWSRWWQYDDNVEKHLTSIGLLYWLTSIPSLKLITLITFDMIKIEIVNLVKLLLKMLKMMFVLPSASSEVVRLWKMAKAVVLRRIFIAFFYCQDHCEDQE